ncbi:MAG: hypothetical protein CML68_16760 [Rhodobacteraceae bacterium]|nr:hypothetical protein [Paracoccaceae bacterium]
MRYVTIFLIALFLGISGGEAQAKRPIRDVPELYEPLFYIAIANEIRKTCPNISERRMYGISQLWQLKNRANQLGYSDKEIEAFYESEEERARMAKRGEAYLARFGADRDDEASLCAFGLSEIERNSAIGVYLKEN